MYYDPWIFGNHVSLFMYIEKSSYDHLFLDRSVQTNTIRVDLGKWHGEKIKLRFSPITSNRSFTNKDTLRYNYFIPEMKLEYDSRDIYWNPKKGIKKVD